jgi:hypothetical protein
MLALCRFPLPGTGRSCHQAPTLIGCELLKIASPN